MHDLDLGSTQLGTKHSGIKPTTSGWGIQSRSKSLQHSSISNSNHFVKLTPNNNQNNKLPDSVRTQDIPEIKKNRTPSPKWKEPRPCKKEITTQLETHTTAKQKLSQQEPRPCSQEIQTHVRTQDRCCSKRSPSPKWKESRPCKNRCVNHDKQTRTQDIPKIKKNRTPSPKWKEPRPCKKEITTQLDTLTTAKQNLSQKEPRPCTKEIQTHVKTQDRCYSRRSPSPKWKESRPCKNGCVNHDKRTPTPKLQIKSCPNHAPNPCHDTDIQNNVNDVINIPTCEEEHTITVLKCDKDSTTTAPKCDKDTTTPILTSKRESLECTKIVSSCEKESTIQEHTSKQKSTTNACNPNTRKNKRSPSPKWKEPRPCKNECTSRKKSTATVPTCRRASLEDEDEECALCFYQKPKGDGYYRSASSKDNYTDTHPPYLLELKDARYGDNIIRTPSPGCVGHSEPEHPEYSGHHNSNSNKPKQVYVEPCDPSFRSWIINRDSRRQGFRPNNNAQTSNSWRSNSVNSTREKQSQLYAIEVNRTRYPVKRRWNSYTEELGPCFPEEKVPRGQDRVLTPILPPPAAESQDQDCALTYENGRDLVFKAAASIVLFAAFIPNWAGWDFFRR